MVKSKKFLKELLRFNLDESIWDKSYFINKTEEFLNFYKIDIYDILENRNIRKKFLEFLLNHYSSFFRDTEDFKFLRKITKPQRILSVGCSSGEEVYSIAIVLYENGILDKSFILGVDLGEIIKKAKKGKWHLSLYQEFERNYILSGGKKNFRDYFIFGDDEFMIKEKFKQKICFKSYDLRKFFNLGKFDSIFFKNVSIYFNDKFNKKVYNWIDKELKTGGYLFVGESDVCVKYSQVGRNIYQKAEE